MLAQQKAEGGLNTGVAGAAGPGRGNKNVVVADDRVSKAPKLSDAGISKDLSSRAQKLAAVPRAAQIRTSAEIVARESSVWKSAGDWWRTSGPLVRMACGHGADSLRTW